MTFKALLNSLSGLTVNTNGKRLTSKMLRESTLKIIYKDKVEDVDIIVYESGDAVVLQHNGKKTRRTVFKIQNVALLYINVKNMEDPKKIKFINPKKNEGWFEIKRELYENESATTILYTYALHKIIGNMQRNSDQRAPESIYDMDETEIFNKPRTMEEISVEKEFIYKALGKLTTKQQEVIILYYFESLTEDQIGRIMGITRAGVQSHRNAAIKKLRKLLS